MLAELYSDIIVDSVDGRRDPSVLTLGQLLLPPRSMNNVATRKQARYFMHAHPPPRPRPVNVGGVRQSADACDGDGASGAWRRHGQTQRKKNL
eukprot:scaffold31695_cov118-Isochrysis_galbana.AAC.9